MLKDEGKNPFYRPLCVRLLLVASVILWSAVEWWNGATFWSSLAAGIAIWAIYTFFITYNPDGVKAAERKSGRHHDEEDRR